ncbi:CsbD family protein [Massilia yuzhufengensis]|uniref:CsbD-like n=1 Tax=Massilia yuzhufengensis TaxID=1164594 RepID=A0A1I1SPB0_9BURK|nr:CsbD family protein [Massilia yuzhufengensis]SFD48191.1 CsbD-like [Massilia yuzhufengensis]
MNEDQVKGKAKDIGGKIQEKVGEATGNRQTQREGVSKQVEGKVQEKAGDVKDVLKGNR